MTQFWCLNKFSKQIKSTQSQFISGNHCEPGTSGCESGNSGIIRILRTWKFISHVLILYAVPKRYKPLFTLLSSLPVLSLSSQALNTKSTIPNPSQDLESCKSAWRIIPSNHSSLGWLQIQLEKVPKLGLNGLIILGCFKRFLLGQSSYYESLY